MVRVFRSGKVPSVKNKELISYRYSCAGDMNGGCTSMELGIIDGGVILTYAHTAWWYEDADILEYKLDSAVLPAVERIFRKYKMQKWNQKKFTNVFVADGPHHSYSFQFQDYTRVSFSSQLYPGAYGRKLSEIDRVIDEYRNQGTLESGLVKREKTDEELYRKNHPDNGLVEMDVYEYSRDKLCVRLLNGTDEKAVVRGAVQLVRNSDGNVLYQESSEYPIEVNAASANEEVIHLSGRLDEGTYTIYVGDYAAVFEIQLQREKHATNRKV